MKKLICFSLWGDDKKYLHGALENAELSKRFYPDWRCRYYISRDNTPKNICEKLNSYDNCEIVWNDETNSQSQRILRFAPLCENDVDYFIVRDLDSRVGEREAALVHDESTYIGGSPYPISRKDGQIPSFIGESFEDFVYDGIDYER